MKRLTSGFLALLVAALPAAAQETDTQEIPKPRRYKVEVIVFTYEENVSVGTEIFPPDEPPPDADELDLQSLEDLAMDSQGVAIDIEGNPIPEFTDTAVAADDIDAAALDEEIEDEGPDLLPIEPVLMLADEFSMQRALEQLERLDAYRPIMHTGWTQATLPPDESTALELAYFGEPPAGLEGSFMLYLGRYLHLVVDLTLAATTGTTPLEGNEQVLMFDDEPVEYDIGLRADTEGVFYRIQEDRIVKNGDVRYFDHPKFGVIAKVTRVEEPEENPEEDPEAGSAPLVASPAQ